MLTKLALVVLALTPALVPAQSTGVTLPKGMGSTEGNSLFALLNRRLQGADFTHKKALVFKSFALRRDGLATISKSGGTVDVTLKIGMCNMGSLSGNLNGNFTATPTTVFSQTAVKFPDWTKKPTSTPAPFNFTLPFSKTYLYLGKQALLWDLTLAKLNGNFNRIDRQSAKSTFASGQVTGPGCGKFTTTLRLASSGPGAPAFGMQAHVSGFSAPASSPVLLSADLKISAIKIPGWCAPVYAAPTFLASLGMSSARGVVSPRSFAWPYLKIAEGLTISTQLVSSDKAGIVLSNGRNAKIPTSPGNLGFDSAYILGGGILAPSLAGNVVYNTGLIAQLK